MTTVDHGFNLQAIRAELDTSDYEIDPEDRHYEIRRVYLGSVFSLTPSGKFYAPFACSNVDACESCKGKGYVAPRRLKRRTIKKWRARHVATMRRFDRLYDKAACAHVAPTLRREYRPGTARAAFRYIDRQPKQFRSRSFMVERTCTACAGLGSREAHLDELWNEVAEKAIESIGAFLSWEDGDAFACESREIQENEESDAS